jgi:hypothetical protein
VFERFTEETIALLFAVASDDRDFADVGGAAVGVAADGKRAVVEIGRASCRERMLAMV